MKKLTGIIIFLTLFIFSSCGTYVTNPIYVPEYEYIIVVDYPQPKRFIPKHGVYSNPRYKTHIYRRGYKFNKH